MFICLSIRNSDPLSFYAAVIQVLIGSVEFDRTDFILVIIIIQLKQVFNRKFNASTIQA